MADKWEKKGFKKVQENWDFEENPELLGVYISNRSNVGKNQSMVYEFEIEKGRKVNVWGNYILDSRMKNIMIGEEVGIVYHGKEISEKSGNEYHKLDVYHRVLPKKKKTTEEDVFDNPA